MMRSSSRLGTSVSAVSISAVIAAGRCLVAARGIEPRIEQRDERCGDGAMLDQRLRHVVGREERGGLPDIAAEGAQQGDLAPGAGLRGSVSALKPSFSAMPVHTARKVCFEASGTFPHRDGHSRGACSTRRE